MASIYDVDQSLNYLVWVNTITVTYLDKPAEKPPLTGKQITNVLWNQIRKDRLPPDSPLQKMDRTFRMAKAVMHDIWPKIDDIIIDDFDVRWVVKIVEVLTYGHEYRVHTIRSTKQNMAVG